MEQITSRIAVTLTGLILIVATLALANIRPEECSPPDILMPRMSAGLAANAPPTPTLAPPKKVVFVHVEADKSDIEVGWAEK